MENPTVVFPTAREVELRDRERPTPGEGEVLIETATTMVSTGTELTVLSGEYPEGSNWDDYGEYPFVAGYTNVGRVVDANGTDLTEGTRVATWTPHAASVTAAAEACIEVPEALSDAQAAPFAIAQIVSNGVRRGRVDWGETVVVYGCGILGQFAVRLCQLAGVRRVFAVDLAADRLDYLPDAPEVVPVDASIADPEGLVAEHTDDAMADVVFEVTGNPDAIEAELGVLRDQGRLVVLSSPHGETTLDFHDFVNAPSHEIIGAHQLSHPDVATRADPWTKAAHADLFFEFVQQDRLSVEGLFSHVREYTDAPALYRTLLEDRTQAMGVRIEW